MSALTKGQWQLSGVRFRMNGGEWQSITAYDAETKQDTSIAAVSIDPRTLAGLADGLVMAASKDLLEMLIACRDQFDFYAQEHRKAEKHEKARTNEKFAFLATQAIKRALSEGEEG